MTLPQVGSSSSGASVTATSASNDLNRQDFLQLLVTQLQNQDPLNPMDDQQFIAQMAQLSALDATNQLAGQVGQLASAQQQMGAVQFVGHTVQYTDNNGNPAQGKVTGVRLDGSAPILILGTQQVPLAQVQTVL